MPRPARTLALLTLSLLACAYAAIGLPEASAQDNPYDSGYENPRPSAAYVQSVAVALTIDYANLVTWTDDFPIDSPNQPPDTFGVIYFPGHGAKSTSVQWNTFNPIWNYGTTYEYDVASYGFDLPIRFDFWDYDRDEFIQGGDDFLGRNTITRDLSKAWDPSSFQFLELAGDEDPADEGVSVAHITWSVADLDVVLFDNQSWNAGKALGLGEPGVGVTRSAYNQVTVHGSAVLSTSGDPFGIRVGSGGFLDILEGGLATTTDQVSVAPGGVIRLASGGTLRAGKKFVNDGGEFQWNGGLLQVSGDPIFVGSPTIISNFNPFALSGDVAITRDRTLQVDGSLIIHQPGGLIVNEGHLDARGDVIVQGYLSVNQRLGDNTASFGLAPGKTVTFSEGGYGYFEGIHEYDDGVEFIVTTGSTLRFDKGLGLRSASVLVDGAPSLVSTHGDTVLQTGALGASDLYWGTGADTANITFRNDAQGELNGNLLLGAVAFNGDVGIMSVESGADVTVNSLSIGANANVTGSGKLTVTGEGSTLLQNFGDFNLLVGGGASTVGEVHVNDGGLLRTGSGLSVVSSTGSITVDGGTLNSRGHLRIIGGKLDVLAGNLTFSPDKFLLFEQGAEGTIATHLNFSNGQSLQVDGGSYLELRGLDLGQSGDGTLNVYGANTVLTTSDPQDWGLGGGTATALFSNQAEAYFDDDLNLATTSVVGTTATLQISTGATVSARSIQLASFTQGEATLTISGAGSTLTQESNSTLTVGGSGASAATVNINGGGELHTGTGITTINPTGVVTVVDGVFNARGDVNIEGGSVALTHNESQLYAETVRLNSGAFTFDGGTLGVERFEGDLTNNGGKISPGRPTPDDTTGLTTIAGDLTDNSGTLVIELGGIERGVEYDSISVTGDVDLSTSLDLSLVDGFELRPGQVFTILQVDGSLTGSLLGLPEGTQVGTFNEEPLWITYINGDNVGAGITLFTSAPISGDYNGDGLVDGLDYAVWRDTYGSLTLPISGADGNGDGVINTADYTVWRDAFAAISLSVPEPSTLVLVSAILPYRVRRRRCVG